MGRKAQNCPLWYHFLVMHLACLVSDFLGPLIQTYHASKEAQPQLVNRKGIGNNFPRLTMSQLTQVLNLILLVNLDFVRLNQWRHQRRWRHHGRWSHWRRRTQGWKGPRRRQALAQRKRSWNFSLVVNLSLMRGSIPVPRSLKDYFLNYNNISI